VADFAGCVGRTAKDASIDNETRADASAEGEKNEVLQVCASLADAEVELGQCAGVAIVLNEYGEVWELFA